METEPDPIPEGEPLEQQDAVATPETVGAGVSVPDPGGDDE
jgi:hypothetical protein